MKFPIRFYCALGVSAAFRVISTKILKRSGNSVQWNGGIMKITVIENDHTFTCITVGKQTPCKLSFVYTSQIKLTARTEPNFGYYLLPFM